MNIKVEDYIIKVDTGVFSASGNYRNDNACSINIEFGHCKIATDRKETNVDIKLNSIDNDTLLLALEAITNKLKEGNNGE